MKIFVCGGAGFIGSNFIRYILKGYKEAQILNFDKLTYSGNPDNLSDIRPGPRYEFVQGDIADKGALAAAFFRFQPDYLINFAAETHVDKSIHDSSEEFVRTNVMGVFNLLELVKQQPAKMYVQVSTDETFGSLPLTGGEKFTEKTAFAPNVPYAATKAAGDLLCRSYHSTWKVPVVVTHCSNNYGPYQYPEKLIPYFTLRCLQGKSLPLYGDGKNVRDWVYVLDHCKALELCLFKGKAGEVYNIGADNELDNVTIAKHILDHFHLPKDRIEFIPDRPGHDRRYAIDASKITKELGWRPEASFVEAFGKTVQWYIDNPEWIKRVQEKTGVFNAHIDLWENHQKTKNKTTG